IDATRGSRIESSTTREGSGGSSTCSSTTSRYPIGPLATFHCIRGMRSRSFHLSRVVDMVDVKKGETLVVVGTRKGLFLFHSRDRKRWSSRGPYFEGNEIRHAILDPSDGKTVYAGATSDHRETIVARTKDFGGKWTTPHEGPRFSKESGVSVTRIWQLQTAEDGGLYAGVEPAGLFRSEDRGGSWASDDALNYHSGREKWEPGGGVSASTRSSRIPATPGECSSGSPPRGSSRRTMQAARGECTTPGSGITASRSCSKKRTSPRASTRWSGTRRIRPSCISKTTRECTAGPEAMALGRSSRRACPSRRAAAARSASRSRLIRMMPSRRMRFRWSETTTA